MRSLRRQLIGRMVGAFALLLGSGGTLAYWAVRESLYDQFDQALRVKALVVITNTEQEDGEVEVHFSDRFLREFDDDVATDFFQVFDEDGDSVERSDSLRRKNLPLRHGSLDEPEYWDLRLPNGEPGRAIGIKFRPRVEGRRSEQPEPVDAVAVVAADRRDLDETVVELRNILAGSGLLLLALTGLVVPLVLRRGLRPLDDVAERAGRIDADSLATRFPVEAMPSELQPIATRLNDLLARLGASFERERRFSSDIAHELRTPLAELRSLAEVALKWPDDRTTQTDRAVLEISLQMEALVARLLALGRAEQGRLPLQQEPVGIEGLVNGVLVRLNPQSAAARLTVEREIPVGATIVTDPVLLRSIVGNLLENAVVYSPPGGVVRVTFERAEGAFLFRVSNVAENLQREDLPRMFERFWRKDPSRTGGEHTGLGLALSRSFAGLLALELTAELDDSSRLTMTLRGSA